jgi:CBS domain-containing membrane protein
LGLLAGAGSARRRTVRVSDIMTTVLVTLGPLDSLKTARETMGDCRIRHLPVVTDDREFLGLLSHRDILTASISKFAELNPKIRDQIESGIPVSEVMTAEVVTVSPGTSLAEAGRLLLERKFGCLPVLERGRLEGILTETDFIKLALRLLEEKKPSR